MANDAAVAVVPIAASGARSRSRVAALFVDGPTPRWLSLAGLVVAAGLIVSRSPYIVRKGRFWAEEGSVYFAHLHLVGPVEGIGFVHQRAGYVNLASNLATALAQLVPLRHAPRVTVWFSMAVLLLIVAIVLVWPSTLLTKPAARVAAALVLVAGTLAAPEVWLTSLHLQAYLGLATVLIAFVAVDRLNRPKLAITIVVLAVAGLSGLYAVALLPVFVFAAWRERGRRRWLLVATLATAAVLQGAAYLTSRASGLLVDKRGELGAESVYRSVAGYHLDGLVLPEGSVARILGPQDAGGSPVLVVLVALAVVAVLGVSFHAIGRRGTIKLALAFVLTEAIVLLGSFQGVAASRYAVVPVGILALVVIGGASAAPPGWIRAVTSGAVVVALTAGLAEFWTMSPTTLGCDGCPSWAAQVATWEKNDLAVLATWPYDAEGTWTIWIPNPPPDPPTQPSPTSPTTPAAPTTTPPTTAPVPGAGTEPTGVDGPPPDANG